MVAVTAGPIHTFKAIHPQELNRCECKHTWDAHVCFRHERLHHDLEVRAMLETDNVCLCVHCYQSDMAELQRAREHWERRVPRFEYSASHYETPEQAEAKTRVINQGLESSLKADQPPNIRIPGEFNALADKHSLPVLNEKEKVYGDPGVNLGCAAAFADIYTIALRGRQLTAADMALFQVLLKIARIATGAYHEDNYTDAVGYLELARELHPGRKGDD